MVKDFLQRANDGKKVYISEVRSSFNSIVDGTDIKCVVDSFDKSCCRFFSIRIPRLSELHEVELRFVKEFVYASIYNILSALGGSKMTFYFDLSDKDALALFTSLNEIFYVAYSKTLRRGYGGVINIIERILESFSTLPFTFEILDIKSFNMQNVEVKHQPKDVYNRYAKVLTGLETKNLLGVDIGGTDIKIVLSQAGSLTAYKEYDWFPAKFTTIDQLIGPIQLLVSLMRAKISLDVYEYDKPKELMAQLENALEINAETHMIEKAISRAEEFLGSNLINFDGIGMCFPDIVIKDKIVGGEVYKLRGIRNNSKIDFESEFKKLTSLNLLLEKYCSKDRVKIINDGPMAAYTAAIETFFGDYPQSVAQGIFAHTLGTELGTGWIDKNGEMLDIPLEIYNFIIDLGSYDQRQFHFDDIRSINNFNSGLPGTLQKYTSQSGVFRLAAKYLPEDRPDLWEELFNRSFIYYDDDNILRCTTTPKDMRKSFLQHLMDLSEKEDCEVCRKIMREIGEYLAVTWLETEEILNPEIKDRVYFGRMVKSKKCFDLYMEGAERIVQNLKMHIADKGLVNTRLMQQLRDNETYTVAQFAQAVGAVYYVNQFS